MPPKSTTEPPKSPPVPKPSHRDLNPVEQGGRSARDGFEYQDQIAVGKCLDMLIGGGPSEVWCEAEDDIVLVWSVDSDEQFEFVQIKKVNIGQAWTVAKLCSQEPAAAGKKKPSILERSLAHDRGAETCLFRIVSSWEPCSDLTPLKRQRDQRTDDDAREELQGVGSKLQEHAGKLTSPNGRGLDFWASATYWEVRATTEDVRNANHVKVERLLDTRGVWLAPDQKHELLDRLFRRVQDASLADGKSEKAAKRLKRSELLQWFLLQADAIVHPTHSGTSANLETKLTAASVDDTSIQVAKEQRRQYLAESRRPKYLTDDDRELLESEVVARLHRLKTQLDAGELPDNGRQFLSRCQQELLQLRTTLPCTSKPTEGAMYGCLYEVMNRCLHRLVRAS